MNGNHELENQLRATLHERAAEAPPGDGVADRVLAEVAAPPAPARARRGWGTWTMPLLAAAAVVAVIATVLGVSRSTDTAEPAHPSIGSTTTHASTPTSPPTSTSSVVPPPPVRDTSPTAVQWDVVSGGARLVHFQVLDATFNGTDKAWLLGTADCLTGPVRPCPAMARTDDGGKTWKSAPTPSSVLQNIRFATPEIGYAFSPSELKMTTNGTDWSTQPGGAVALETLDSNVIRVEHRNAACSGLCTDVVETSSVGGTTWTPSNLPAFRASTVQLQRTHGHAYLLVQRSARAATTDRPDSSLYESVDGGTNWQARPDACRRAGPGYATASMAVGAAGSTAHLLCRNARGHWAIVAGHKRATMPFGTADYAQVELGASDPRTLFVVADRLYRSADGGQTWHAVLRYAPNSDLGPPEFESPRVGRWFTDGGRVVWTTTDSGRTWHGVGFSS